MSTSGLAGLAAVLVLAVAPSGAGAAAPQHDHGIDGPFPAEFCGVSGTAIVRSNNVATDFGNDTVFSRGGFTLTFDANATGKSITLHGAGADTTQIVVNQQAGTVTINEAQAGLPILIKVTHGPVLSRDAGYLVLERTFTYDPAEENGVGELISTVVSLESGPHPLLASGGDLCALVEPYLLDP